jgi:hypothetical protein
MAGNRRGEFEFLLRLAAAGTEETTKNLRKESVTERESKSPFLYGSKITNVWNFNSLTIHVHNIRTYGQECYQPSLRILILIRYIKYRIYRLHNNSLYSKQRRYYCINICFYYIY